MTERPRTTIEQDIKDAEQAVEIALADLEAAEEDLRNLEAELEALPPEGLDEELWYAHRDPRQLSLNMGSKLNAR